MGWMQCCQRLHVAQFGFRCIITRLHTDNLSLFDNRKFDIFDTDGPQCHIITSVLRAGRFP